MDYFGINSTDDLPKIREVLAEQLVEGTLINSEDFNQKMEVLDDNIELVAITEVETIISEEEKTTDDNLDSAEANDEQAV
jgi:segregation and condensation protein B